MFQVTIRTWILWSRWINDSRLLSVKYIYFLALYWVCRRLRTQGRCRKYASLELAATKTTLLISIFSPFDMRHTKKGIWRFWYFHVVVSVSFTFEGEVRLTTKERSKPVIFHVKGPKHKVIFLLCYLFTAVCGIWYCSQYTRHTKELRAVTSSAKTNGTFKKLWFL